MPRVRCQWRCVIAERSPTVPPQTAPVTLEIAVIAAIRIAGSLPSCAGRWVAASSRSSSTCPTVALYAYRLVGFFLFELLGDRALLLVFPNVFEFCSSWWRRSARRVAGWSIGRLEVVLLTLTLAKEAQEWAIHGARLFDGISSLEFLDRVRRSLMGG